MSEETDRVAVELDAWPDDVDDDEGVVIAWFVGEGDPVEAGQVLCEVQVEKVDVDVHAPTDGTVMEVVRDEDDEFTRDDVLAWLDPA